MALDFPGSGRALWNLCDATGIRPEWLLPVMFHESGFRPSFQNLDGADNWGLIQMSGYMLLRLGVTPPLLRLWPASTQIARVITPYFKGQVHILGPLTSAVKVYQCVFLPGSLMPGRPEYAPNPTDVITRAGNAFYEGNRGLDTTGSGTITPNDLAAIIAMALVVPDVHSAIDRTYFERPNEVRTNPLTGVA